MTKRNGMSASALLRSYEPRSESRHDLVERDEEMQRRIKARRRDNFIFCALAAIFVVFPLLALSIQSASLTKEQRQVCKHTIC